MFEKLFFSERAKDYAVHLCFRCFSLESAAGISEQRSTRVAKGT
jgi:hypothetical protein